MVTRAERVDEAIAFTEEHPELLWALALNEVPVRRDYLKAITGLDRRLLVRTLARMANAGILAATEGIEFEVDRKAFAREIEERIPDEDAVRIHKASLHWHDETQSADDAFILRHLVGARLYPEVADLVSDRIRERAAEGEPQPRQELEYAKRALLGLLDEPTEQRGRFIELGLLMFTRGRVVLKPLERKNLAATMRELGLGADQEAELAALEAEAKQESKQRRLEKKQTEGQMTGDASTSIDDAAPPTPDAHLEQEAVPPTSEETSGIDPALQD